MNGKDQSKKPATSQKIQIPPDARAFLVNLMQEAQIKPINDNENEEMLEQLFIRLDKYIAATIVNNLPTEKDVEVFIKMNQEKKTQEELQKYIKDKIPNADEIFAQMFIDFRGLYIGNTPVENAPTK